MTHAQPDAVTLLLMVARSAPLHGGGRRGSGEGGEGERGLTWGAGVDWHTFLQGARRHALVPLAYRHLSACGSGTVPDAVLAALRAGAEDAARTGLHLTAQLLRVLDTLEGAGVGAIPFKGPVLERRLHGQAAGRSFGDLDLLVRTSEATAAVAALEGVGYRVDAASPRGRAAALSHDPVLTLVREGDAPVELHREMVHPLLPGPFDLAGVWDRAGSLAMGGRTVRDLHRDDLLLLLCLHGAKHGWDRLGWVADVARLVEVETAWDWPALLRRARREGLGRTAVTGLYLAHDLLGAPLAPDAGEEVERDGAVRALGTLVRDHLAGPPPGAAYHLRFHWLSAEGWRGRGSMIRRTLFTPSPADRDAVAVPGWLGWLRSVVRPFRLARTYAFRGRRG